jgi:hypothetical protein
MKTSEEIVLVSPQDMVRQSTDIAGLCKEIVVRTALEIQGRKFVRVEGWQSIATAHGCTASARDVQRVEGGMRAMGEIRRMSDGVVIATAEGFVGEDEPTWYGGEVRGKTLPKRPEYAIRAMCQTRAISRACRTAFAHVVVLMDANLATTPAEEVPEGGFQDSGGHVAPPALPKAAMQAEKPRRGHSGANGWRSVPVPPFIKKYARQTLGDMAENDLLWWAVNYQPKPFNGEIQQKDLDLRAALDAAQEELHVPAPINEEPDVRF